MKTNLLDEKKGESRDNDDDEPVSFFRLFRFSSLWDKVLIFIGCIIAVSAGLAFIVMIVLIGNVLDAFVDSLLLPNYTSGTDTGISTDVADELLTEIIKFCIYYTSLGAIFFCLNVIMISSLSIAAANQAFRIKCLFMKAILHQNIGWFDTNQTGDFATLITGNLTRIQDGIGASVGICISLLSQSIFAFACAVYYGWKLSLIMMFIMVIILILTTIISKFQAKATIREKATYGLAGAVAEEVLSSIKTVAAFGGENKEIERYNSYVTRTRTQGIKRSLITSVGASILSSAFFLSCALTFWYGIILIVDGRITGDEEYKTNTLIIVSFNIMGCAQSTAQISPHLEAFNIARGSATKLFKIIERIPPLDSTSEDGDKPKSIIGDITLENVHFSYPARADVKVLQGFSLKVKSGETVALVGLSGCGKSTIVQLIQRFYDVDRGQVKIDKHDVKDLNIGWLRRHIGVVGQEPILFSTTIAENIRYGKSNASLLEIEKAAEIANAHDFISKLPKGYDTLIGSGGMQLSGGQKQRIAIARAIMKDPKILLLDEATSALDGENEYIVQTALDKARQNKTTIVIAHQLSTVRTADKIVTISGGAVKEMGTHNELMARKGLYYQLFMKQDTIEYKPPRMENTLVIPNPSLYASDDSTGSVCHGSAQRLFFAVDDPAYLNKELSTSIKPSGMRLLKFSFPELPYVSIGCVSAFAAGVCPLFYGIIFGDILQLLSKDDNTILSDITYYSSIFIAISIGSGVSTFMQTLMFSIAGEGLTLRLRKKAFSAIVYQDMSWFDLPQNSVGALCSRLSSDTSDVQVVSGIRISVIMQAVSTIVSTIGIAFYFNWQLGLVALSSIPLGLLITYLENVMTSKRTLSYKTAVGEASKVAIEAIVNIRTVASLHQENIFYSQFKMALISPLRKSWTNAIVRGVVYGFARVISPFQYAATLYFGSIHVAYNNMPYGNLIKVSEVIAVGSDMIAQAVVFSPDYHKARLAAGRVFQLLDQKPKINKFSDRKEDLENWSGNIEFKNVHFKYPNRPEIKILRDFNLQIKPEQTVALVGSSGCGKSTCIQLIERFYETYQGELRADGKNIKHLQLSSLRNQVGLVSQEPVLFSESIARNIAYGDNGRDIPVAEIITAARNANIHEFISTLPQGYSTVLGEKGTQLSGGQKQRIALARALIRKPKLLLLDEATSSLDAENEKIVQEALDKASDGRTCITIAHRLSTIQNADVIAVIRKGRITERGTHQELLKLRGHYYKLYTAQDERNHQIIKS